jgi:hypothetical protein
LQSVHAACLRFAGVLAGLFWLQKGKNNTVLGAQQTIGLLFFELLFLSFRALFVALFTFPDERKMLLKVSYAAHSCARSKGPAPPVLCALGCHLLPHVSLST